MVPYQALFPAGTSVRVRDRDALVEFGRQWKLHNPLSVEQVAMAGRVARVLDVGFYHGGDPLYVLEGLPGTWHEGCLLPVAPDRAG